MPLNSTPAEAAKVATEGLKDMNLTPDEVNKFEKAFKDPEFMKMFMEYAEEVSDPKNRAETEAYLKQIEGEGRAEEVYGKGVELVAPNAGFVVKTKNRKNKEKVFINVCYTDKLDDFSEEKKKGGMNINVPYSLGPSRREKDKKGLECDCHDFAVSTATYRRGESNPRFKKFLCETAIENVQNQRGGNLDLAFTLPSMKYKGEGLEGPQVMAFRTSADGSKDGGAKKEGAAAPPAVSKDGRIKPQSPGVDPSILPGGGEGAGKSSGFSFDKKTKPKPPPPKEGEVGWVNEDGEVVPKHEIVYRGQVDLQTTWKDDPSVSNGAADHSASYTRTRPETLVVRIELPELSSIKGVDLEVNSRRVEVVFPGKYNLDLALPYEVNDDLGKAKFDKSKKVLEVTLPVTKGEAPAPKKFVEPPKDQEPTLMDLMEAKSKAFGHLNPTKLDSSGGGGGSKGADEDEPDEDDDDAPGAAGEGRGGEPERDAGRGAAGGKGEAAGESEEEREKRRVWEEYCNRHDRKAREASEGAEREREESERAAREAAVRARSEEAARLAEELKAALAAAGGGDPIPFLARDSFVGWQEGYVFKTGDLGLGYYADVVKAGGGGGEGAKEEEGGGFADASGFADAELAKKEPPSPQQRLKPRLNRAVLDDLD